MARGAGGGMADGSDVEAAGKLDGSGPTNVATFLCHKKFFFSPRWQFGFTSLLLRRNEIGMEYYLLLSIFDF